MVLGVVGGFQGLVWGLLSLIFGGYQSFKYENSMIRSLYPTVPANYDPWADVESEENLRQARAQKAMMDIIAKKGRYTYGYVEYLGASTLKLLCSCCCSKSDFYQKRVKRLERHEAAQEKLGQEVDLVKLLQVHRMVIFIAQLGFKKHQRALISNFKRYQIEDFDDQEPDKRDSKVTQQSIQAEEASLVDFDPD